MTRTRYRIVPKVLLRDSYEVEKTAAELRVPLLVILSTADSVVPPQLNRRLFEDANEPKRLVDMEGFDQNELGLGSGAKLAEEIKLFVDVQVVPG